MGFIGRRSELAELNAHLDDVRRSTHRHPGVVVVVRGPRRVGKSRLAAEFVGGCGAPSAHIEARDIEATTEELLTRIDELAGPKAAVVVIDNASSLLRDPSDVDSLRRTWDHHLARRRILLLLLVSQPDSVDAPTGPDRAWRGRSATLTVEPVDPAEIAELTGQDAFGAIDSYLITGGLPLSVAEWERDMARDDFLRASFERSTSALVVTGQRLLDASLPDTSYARSVLAAIGRGERTFTNIHNAVADGSMSRNSLTANLEALSAAGLIVGDEPLSTRPAPKDRRWRVIDPALSFWLTFVEPVMGAVDRSRPDEAMRLVNEGYGSWRVRTVAAVVHDALARLLPERRWPEVRRVGGWWSRGKSAELAVVGADDAPASRVSVVGTIAWRRIDPLSTTEIGRLAADAAKVPGVDGDTALVAVCPAGCTADDRIAQVWSAEDLLDAWTRAR